MPVIDRSAQNAKSIAPLSKWLVVIGANTGGPQALLNLLPKLPADFPGTIIVIQQMRPGFTRVLVDQLSYVCKLPVYEPEDGQALQPGRILVAPANSRLSLGEIGDPVAPGYSILLEDIDERPQARRDRIDTAMTSAARFFGPCSIGVLLSGLGTDGCEGLRSIRNAGGATIAQDDATSVVHAMPAAAIEAGVVQEVLPLWSIADRIVNLVAGGEAGAVAA